MGVCVAKLEAGDLWAVICPASETALEPLFSCELSARIFAYHYTRVDARSGDWSEQETCKADIQRFVEETFGEGRLARAQARRVRSRARKCAAGRTNSVEQVAGMAQGAARSGQGAGRTGILCADAGPGGSKKKPVE